MELDKEPVLVLYIVGAGHSGSTLLDIVLGNHPKIASSGELGNFIRKGWINGRYCGCGKWSNKCQFWSNVYKEWTYRVGVNDAVGYLALQNAFERFRCWLRLQKERRRLAGSGRFGAYADRTQALFEAVRAVSGKSIIVDSSKNPVRALALSMISGVDLRVVHLVRDGRGVIWSYMKKKNMGRNIPSDRLYTSSWRAGFLWFLINVSSEFVLWKTGLHGVRIKYEDFVEQPEEVLKQIGQMLEIKFDAVAKLLSSGKEVVIGHPIAGNRIRMAGSIRFRPDYEWKKLLPKNVQRIFWLLAGSLARKYGYSWI